jgi:hypothetical protein
VEDDREEFREPVRCTGHGRKADLLLSSLKALNNLSPPDPNTRDKSAYQTYVQRIDNVGYELTRALKDSRGKIKTMRWLWSKKFRNRI